MEDVKDYLKKNICIFCPNNKKENCMKLQTKKTKGLIVYKCLNFQKQEKPKKVYEKFIKFEYLNESNEFVGVIIKETPQQIIDELKIKYDLIEFYK